MSWASKHATLFVLVKQMKLMVSFPALARQAQSWVYLHKNIDDAIAKWGPPRSIPIAKREAWGRRRRSTSTAKRRQKKGR